MWGLFIGIAIGVGQVLALKLLGQMIFGEHPTWIKLIGGLLLLAKVALIVGILYLLSTVSFAHLIWTAGGMLIGLISVSVFQIRRRNNTDREDTHVE